MPQYVTPQSHTRYLLCFYPCVMWTIFIWFYVMHYMERVLSICEIATIDKIEENLSKQGNEWTSLNHEIFPPTTLLLLLTPILLNKK